MADPEFKIRGPSLVSEAIPEIEVLWITAGLGCDGDTIAITAATQPSLEDILLGALPGIPQVKLHNPFLSYENGEDFLEPFYRRGIDPAHQSRAGSVRLRSCRRRLCGSQINGSSETRHRHCRYFAERRRWHRTDQKPQDAHAHTARSSSFHTRGNVLCLARAACRRQGIYHEAGSNGECAGRAPSSPRRRGLSERTHGQQDAAAIRWSERNSTTISRRASERPRVGGLSAHRPGTWNRRIAEELHLSVKTVESSREHIKEKMILDRSEERRVGKECRSRW